MSHHAPLRVEIQSIEIDMASRSPIVILSVPDRSTIFSLWVGIFEANGIAVELERMVPPRPMTHDLLKNAIQALGGSISRVAITDFRDDVFFATVYIEYAGRMVFVDARPSDAFALALRAGAPIFVDSTVLDEITTFPDIETMRLASFTSEDVN